MESQKDSLKNPQTNKNNRLLSPKSVRSEGNPYISPVLNISEQNNIKVSYQNTLPRPYPEQNLVAPNYYLHNEVAFSQGFRPEVNYTRESRGFPPEVNYARESQGFRTEVNYERESAVSQRSGRYNTKADETSDTGVNKEHEKENFIAEKEPKVSKSNSIMLILLNYNYS
jgi:hypothetical protein